MKKSYLALLALAPMISGCMSANFGQRYEVKKYDGLTGDMTEGFSCIRAIVSVSATNGLSTAELRTRHGRKLIVAWNEGLPPISSLDSTKTYQFDLIVAIGKEIRYTLASVYRISDGDKVIVDLSRCSLHQCSMHREEEYWNDASTSSPRGKVKTYPNSGIFYPVGGSGIHHVVWVCPACRHAEEKEIARVNSVR